MRISHQLESSHDKQKMIIQFLIFKANNISGIVNIRRFQKSFFLNRWFWRITKFIISQDLSH